MKLNLGCGFRKLEGYLNVDKQPACGPDLLLDLEQLPWPFDDSSVSEVMASHVIEHLGQEPKVFLGIVKELYRVMAPDARLHIIVPHPRSDLFLADPTHVRPIMPETLLLFSKRQNRSVLAKGGADTPLALYLDVDFEPISVEYVLSSAYAAKLGQVRTTNPDPALEKAVRERFNVIQQLTIVMRKIAAQHDQNPQ
jgi:hypothetical protein